MMPNILKEIRILGKNCNKCREGWAVMRQVHLETNSIFSSL